MCYKDCRGGYFFPACPVLDNVQLNISVSCWCRLCTWLVWKTYYSASMNWHMLEAVARPVCIRTRQAVCCSAACGLLRNNRGIRSFSRHFNVWLLMTEFLLNFSYTYREIVLKCLHFSTFFSDLLLVSCSLQHVDMTVWRHWTAVYWRLYQSFG